MRKFFNNFVLFFALFLTINILIFSERTLLVTRESLKLCSDVIFPSLFPFLICSNLLIDVGVARSFSYLFSPIAKRIFNVSGSASLPFILGIITGYPIGAATVASLYENLEINADEAERMLAFCNNSGPAFIISLVGVGLFKDQRIGLFLYLIHVFSAVLTGILFRFLRFDFSTSQLSLVKKKSSLVTNSIVSSTVRSIETIFKTCGIIILFSIFVEFIPDIKNLPLINSLTTGFFEITNGVIKLFRISNLSLNLKLSLVSFIIAFSGISVFIQVFSIFENLNVSIFRHLIGKFLHAFLAFFTSEICLKFLKIIDFKESDHVFAKEYCFLNNCDYNGSYWSLIYFLIFSLLLVLTSEVLKNLKRIVSGVAGMDVSKSVTFKR